MENYERRWPARTKWKRAEEALRKITAEVYSESATRFPEADDAAMKPSSVNEDGTVVIDLTAVEDPAITEETAYPSRPRS